MNATKTTTKQTAAAAYAERAATTTDLLKRIAAQLVKDQKAQAADPRNWGYVGSLGHVNEELAQVLGSMGDDSACIEMGLSR